MSSSWSTLLWRSRSREATTPWCGWWTASRDGKESPSDWHSGRVSYGYDPGSVLERTHPMQCLVCGRRGLNGAGWEMGIIFVRRKANASACQEHWKTSKIDV
ncbi:unnamed protein product [Ectocarpus sp. 12 AP-2014]